MILGFQHLFVDCTCINGLFESKRVHIGSVFGDVYANHWRQSSDGRFQQTFIFQYVRGGTKVSRNFRGFGLSPPYV